MSFYSLKFGLFLAGALTAYWLAPQRLRWAPLLACSYIFCALLSRSAAAILLCVSAMNYLFGLWIGSAEERRKWRLLLLAIACNLSALIVFKYSYSLVDILNRFRSENIELPDFLLPVGVSFYIFQSLSYLIDIYLGRAAAEKHPGRFLLYLSFFPKLVLGPIERAGDFLPQITEARTFDPNAAIDGFRLILAGFFKRAFIAMPLARVVNAVFGKVDDYAGAALWIAIYALALEIYFELSSYVDAARGLGKLFGIELSENFNAPFSATNIQEFWRRWHITLSLWFRDYLFMPLTAQTRDYGKAGLVFSALATFVLIGAWHGEAWGFLVFGALQGIYMAVSILTLRAQETFLRGRGLEKNAAVAFARRFITFNLVAFSLYFFHCHFLFEAGYVFSHLGGSASLTVIAENLSIPERAVLAAAAICLFFPSAIDILRAKASVWSMRSAWAPASVSLVQIAAMGAAACLIFNLGQGLEPVDSFSAMCH